MNGTRSLPSPRSFWFSDSVHNLTRVPLPPTYTFAEVGSFSGNIKYTVGVNVAREGLGAIDEEFDVNVQYLPLSRVVPREETTFPYLPLREDWPFAREVVGGWTLTPFGGRGRIGEQLVELEGILGIQEPAVYTAGQTLPFSLLLWSPSALAMQALAQPGAIDVGFLKSDIFARDALYPRNTVRKNRKLERLADGRIWLTDEGRPEEGAGKPECKLVDLPEPSGKGPAPSPVKATMSPARPSRMQAVWGPDVDDEESTTDGAEQGKDDEGDADARAPSPTPSLEDLDSEPDGERTVRLDGEVRVPACSHPSFRFSSMAREYVLHILIQHPQYSHISPSATGIIGEVPVWYTLNRFAHRSEGDVAAESRVDYTKLPIRGAEIPVGEGAVRLPLNMASVTTQKRPTYRLQRVAAF
ncbi:hypothetical protein FB45DRAFT_479923 [Roridomyces roridus]|uniref:Arrestin-like N-terminal domain-containing protein n=1 Tax=Roridomyces roridus TaxID=1738132 RepID=A0AAD7C1G8_9AGAR|nr:hypothetical protein FB45DRAFT_479923 [Roridomyces roridus]